MPGKLSYDEFQKMLEDPECSDERIARYLKVKDGSGAFNPEFEADPELVEAPRFESAMTIGNWVCRQRRRSRFIRRIRRGVDLPVVVSEGDSWFQFPFLINDVIDQLEDDYLIWSCGAAGDTAENMIFDNPEYMSALDEQGDRVGAFLLSAAGNDVIGEDANGVPVLEHLLHRNTASRATARELINKSELERVLERLGEAYQTVIDTVRGDRRFTELPILIHAYDYALPYPNNRGDRRNPLWASRDEWLGSPMEKKDIKASAVRREIVEYLINELYDLMTKIAAQNPHVHLIDIRGTLTKTTDWADEIHGTSDGFKRVAAKFRKVLSRVVADRPTRHETVVAGYQPDETRAQGHLENEPDFLIGTFKEAEVKPERLGFGDTSKFAKGFQRTRDGAVRDSRPELAVDEDDSVPFCFLDLGTKRGRAVCKIETDGTNFEGISGPWNGTGFLIAPNILMTNHHVLNTPEVAARARAIFDYQATGSGAMASSTFFSLNPDRLFITSDFDDLDYTFVWIDGAPQDTYGLIELWRGSFMGAEGASANIIHHPRGKPKRASLEKNEIIELGLEEVLVHYAADTDPGSSGAPVFNDDWRLFALHHAATHDLAGDLKARVKDAGYDAKWLNEGIKTSAIAIDIEHRARGGIDQDMARQVQEHLCGTDSRTGFFGTLGRHPAGRKGYEIVVDTYRGATDDVDIAFWNIEWFNRKYHSKLNDVARIVADLNLDIWVFEESSPEATEALAEVMHREFDLTFDIAASEPNASSGKQTTTVMWNSLTVSGERLDWPDEIDDILRLRSDDPRARRYEAVEGKIFNRYPGLFRFTARRPDGLPPFDFNLVPLHLKAKAEGARRREMASNVLADVVGRMIGQHDADTDWVIGGDVNAELETGQFDGLVDAGFRPMSAEDERGGAITYLSNRYKSLIDTVFLSPGLSRMTKADDFMIIAPDRADPGFIDRVSDHRPVMVRLSLGDLPEGGSHAPAVPGRTTTAGRDDDTVRRFLDELRRDTPSVLEEIADILRRR